GIKCRAIGWSRANTEFAGTSSRKRINEGIIKTNLVILMEVSTSCALDYFFILGIKYALKLS
ncbi:MAG: hypothetical protein ACJAWS_002429, partial [Oleiphilaceae bacterium]